MGIGKLERRIIREEHAVDDVISALRSSGKMKASVKLGQLRGSPPEFLNLFKYLTKNTALEGAKLRVRPVRAKVSCTKCDWRGDPDIQPHAVRCPRCLKDVDILKGHELEIKV